MKKSLVILSVFAAGLSYAQKATLPTFSAEKEGTKTSQQHVFKTKAEKQSAFRAQEVEAKRIQKAEPAKELTIMSEDATFPKFVNSGDARVDNDNYATQKAAWIENNATKYESLNTHSTMSKAEAKSARVRNINNQKN